jgi:hypothetical protein
MSLIIRSAEVQIEELRKTSKSLFKPPATRLPKECIIPEELKELESPIIYATVPQSPAVKENERTESVASAPGNLQKQEEFDVKSSASTISNGAPIPLKTEFCHPSLESSETLDFQEFEKVCHTHFLTASQAVVSSPTSSPVSSSPSTFNVDAPAFIPRIGSLTSLNVDAPVFKPGQPVVFSPFAGRNVEAPVISHPVKKGKPGHKVKLKSGALMTISRNKACVNGAGCEEKSSCPVCLMGD